MLICPTDEEMTAQTLALLPRGRAWQTHDGGPHPGTVLHQFWTAIAVVFAWLNRRVCALYPEFFCGTAVETRDMWLREYGLPDACDPFPDLCSKVTALGGARCAYYAAIAARAGWDIDCLDRQSQCGSDAGNAQAGLAIPGVRLYPAQIIFRVYLATSPAWVGGVTTPAMAGALQAGGALNCPPDIGPLACILDRIIHAHNEIFYEVYES